MGTSCNMCPAKTGHVGDSPGGRPVEARAVGVERRPVNLLIACAACPCCVSATVPKAGLVSHQDLAEAEGVSVGHLALEALGEKAGIRDC